MSEDAILVLLSGEIASGKTSVAGVLEAEYGFKRIRTGAYLASVASSRDLSVERESLQKLGDVLDSETAGAWVVDLTEGQISHNTESLNWVFDSVRRDFQLDQFKERFGSRALHIHLTAPPEVLQTRYSERRKKGDERDTDTTYAAAKASRTEQHAATLGNRATIRIDTHVLEPRIAAASIAATCTAIRA